MPSEDCGIHDALLETTYPVGTKINACVSCASALSGNSRESIKLEERYKNYRENKGNGE